MKKVSVIRTNAPAQGPPDLWSGDLGAVSLCEKIQKRQFALDIPTVLVVAKAICRDEREVD